MRTLLQTDELNRLRERLQQLRTGDQARWGVMCAAEMVCHVRGAFRTAMGEIPFEPVATPIPRVTLKAIALWAPVPWKRNFQTIPTLKRGMPAMQTGVFTVDVAETVAVMERFCRPSQLRVDHAFFGAMSTDDWMRWGYLHTDHHLRQFGR